MVRDHLEDSQSSLPIHLDIHVREDILYFFEGQISIAIFVCTMEHVLNPALWIKKQRQTLIDFYLK